MEKINPYYKIFLIQSENNQIICLHNSEIQFWKRCFFE